MRFSDVGMIAADTSRSKAYLQALSRHALFPAHTLVLRNPAAIQLPGQIAVAHGGPHQNTLPKTDECWSEMGFDVAESLEDTLTRMGVSADVIDCTDINRVDVVDKVRAMPEPVMIYSGYGGVLLKEDILSTGKRFLHVHGGYLPDYKGSTTNYYSLLIEGTLGASSLFLSAEIDSGPVLRRRKFPAPADRLSIDHVYDSAVRARVLIETLEAYAKCGEWRFEVPENAGGENYYIIHPVLKHIAILAEPQVNRCG